MQNKQAAIFIATLVKKRYYSLSTTKYHLKYWGAFQKIQNYFKLFEKLTLYLRGWGFHVRSVFFSGDLYFDALITGIL